MAHCAKFTKKVKQTGKRLKPHEDKFKIIHMKKRGKRRKSNLYTKLYTLSTAFMHGEGGMGTEQAFCEVLIKNEKRR